MADFHQNGVVPTLHNLREHSQERMEKELTDFSASRPITLILPSLYSELEAPALEHIVSELSQVSYISEIVIGLDQADEKQFRHAKDYFSRLPQKHTILWHDGPRMRAIDEKLKVENLSPDQPGKGRNVWFCMGLSLIHI